MQEEIRSSRHSVRRFLWRSGDGLDLGRILATDQKAEEMIQERTFEPRPLNVFELEEKLYNFKTWIGAVIVIGTDEGHMVDDMMAYGILLNAMACNEGWIATGEVNKEGVFHVHCICKTGVRSDSWKRTLLSIWKQVQGHALWFDRYGVTTLDVAKCQKVHKYTALLQYMCKDPTWILSNKEPYLQQTKDIDAWGMSKRFQSEKKEISTDTANPMVAEILQAINEYTCKTMEELMKSAPELCVKYLHRPGFSGIVQNCLQFAKVTGATWNIKNFAKYDPDPSCIHAILLTQDILPTNFDFCLYQWITKYQPKRNTLILEGPSNTGKTTFFLGLKSICPHGEIVNGLTFNFEGLQEQYWGLWDEPLCAPEVVEKFKQIAGGETTQIPVKFKKPATLPRTPILVCTNTPLWRWCPNQETMLRNRAFHFYFNYDVSNGQFVPRCSESGCKCYYCKISRRGETAASCSTDPTSVPGSEQPGETGKQLDSGDESAECSMGTRSMSSRAGSSGSTHGCRRRRRRRQSSYTTAGGGTSTTTSSSDGSDTEYGSSDTGKRICSKSSRSIHFLESPDRRGNSRHDSRRMESDGGGNGNRSQDTRRYSSNDENGKNVVSLGRSGNNKPEMDLQISSKEQQMDREMATLKIPDKDIWCKYLSFLYHRYRDTPITNLTCTEILADSDSD
nr:MAG: nonstructural protein 1 [Duck parvovirus]